MCCVAVVVFLGRNVAELSPRVDPSRSALLS